MSPPDAMYLPERVGVGVRVRVLGPDESGLGTLPSAAA
jgi:hypothetical protein